MSADVPTGATRACPNCGTTVRVEQPFCHVCGTDLRTAAAGSTEPSAPPPAGAPTSPIPSAPVAPMPTPGPPTDAASATPAPPWPAWLGAATSGVLAVAIALPWVPGLSADAFGIPLAALWSDTATGGPSLAIALLVVAGLGLGLALFRPERRTLGIVFVVTGALGTALMGWYLFRLFRVASSLGGSFLDAVSYGVWIAAAASVATLVAGLLLGLGRRQAIA